MISSDIILIKINGNLRIIGLNNFNNKVNRLKIDKLVVQIIRIKLIKIRIGAKMICLDIITIRINGRVRIIGLDNFNKKVNKIGKSKLIVKI